MIALKFESRQQALSELERLGYVFTDAGIDLTFTPKDPEKDYPKIAGTNFLLPLGLLGQEGLATMHHQEYENIRNYHQAILSHFSHRVIST